MCSWNYGIKNPDYNSSFIEIEWLNPQQLINKLKINDINQYNLNSKIDIVYPSELVKNDHLTVIDLIFLAKFIDSYGNLKLKSVLLSQIITDFCSLNSSIAKSNKYDRLFILSLPQNTYYWSPVRNAHVLPKHALRIGFDNIAKNLTYIGRIKITSMTQGSYLSYLNQQVNTNKITNLFGALINVYEYIPAIVLQLHHVSEMDKSNMAFSSERLYSQQNLKLCVKNIDFNLVSNNYEVLCLRKQPASLKQTCVNKLIKLEEAKQSFSWDSLPNSIRNLLWPANLIPGQCIVKNGKMRSSNNLYEIFINDAGLLKLTMKLVSDTSDHAETVCSRSIIFEKNVESLIVSLTGVYLIYENNQTIRRPKVLFITSDPTRLRAHSYVDENIQFESSVSKKSFFLELSNTGFLRVVMSANTQERRIINLIDLNECFKSDISPSKISTSMFINNVSYDKMSDNKMTNYPDKNFRTHLKIFINCLIKILEILRNLIKKLIHFLFIRLFPVPQFN
jgi:hypothetical protein